MSLQTDGMLDFLYSARMQSTGGFHVGAVAEPVLATTNGIATPILWATPQQMAVLIPKNADWGIRQKCWFSIGPSRHAVDGVLGSIESIDRERYPALAVINLMPESANKARALLALFLKLVRQRQLTLPSTTLASDERLNDADCIRSAVLSLRATRARGYLSRLGSRTSLGVRIKDIQPGHLPIIWELDGPLEQPRAPFVIESSGYNALYNLPINRFEYDGRYLKSEMPHWIRRFRHRAHRRVSVTRKLSVQFTHPHWKELVVDASIRDISMHGFSINADCLEYLLYPGLAIPNVYLYTGSQVFIEGSVITKTIAADGTAHVGFKFERLEEPARKQWQRLVSDLLHPHTLPGYRFLGGTWDTYRDSGYFSLSGKSPQYFSRLRKAFFHASRRLADEPELSSHAIWSTNGEVNATISMAKSHDRTWLVYQLARAAGNADATPGGEILRELYFRCYEDAERDHDLKWLLAYVQTNEHWSRVIHYDLVRQFELRDASLAYTHRFRALEIDTQIPRYITSNGVIATTASDVDLSLVCHSAERTHSAVWADALDLVDGRVASSHAKERYTSVGLLRDRAVFVCRRHGIPEAAIICDTTSEGIHLFGLLDTARILPLQDHKVRSDTVHILIHSAARWFHAHKKRIYVLLDDHDYLAAESSNFIEDMGLADQTILAATALPDMLEYVQSKTHPREWIRLLEEKHG